MSLPQKSAVITVRVALPICLLVLILLSLYEAILTWSEAREALSFPSAHADLQSAASSLG